MTTNTYFTVVNNANSVCQGQFKTREQAEVLADNLQEQAITEHHNHQIIYSVEQIEVNEPTTDKERLFNEIWAYSANSACLSNIEEIIGRSLTDEEIHDLGEFCFMAGDTFYTEEECDIEAKRIAAKLLDDPLADLVEDGLTLVETTGTRNGYPSQVANAITGFTSWEQAKTFAHINNLCLIWLDRRDGWNLWHRGNEATEPMNITEEDYGDGCEFFSSEEQAIERMKDEFDCVDHISLAHSIVDYYTEVIDECSLLEDGEVVVTMDKMVEGRVNTKAIEWHYDTKHIILAAV